MRGGELLGRFETFVNPGRPDPAHDHGAHRHHRGDAAARAAHRRGAALVPRVRARRGDRRPQHPVRLRLPRCRARRSTATRGSRTGASTPSRSRAGSIRDEVPNLKLGTLGPSLPHRGRARSPRLRRRGRDRRGAARAARTGGRVRRARPRRSRCALPTMRAHPSAAKLALTSKLPRLPGVYLFRDRGGRVLYVGQGDQPPSARAVVLLDRRPAQGAAAAARDDAHRAPRVPRPVRGGDPRAAPDPAARAPLQPPVEVVAALLLPQAHRRAVPALDGDPRRARRWCVVPRARSVRAPPRTVPARRSKTRCRSGAAARGSAAKRRSSAGPPCVPAQLGVATCPCRAQVSEESYAELAEAVRRGLDSRPGAAVRAARSAHASSRGSGTVRGGGRARAIASPRSRRRCNGSGRWRRYAARSGS